MRKLLFRKLSFTCLIILLLCGVMIPSTMLSASPTTQSISTNLDLISPNNMTTIAESFQTRLLVVSSSKYDSIADLNVPDHTPKINIPPLNLDSEKMMLQKALAYYGISSFVPVVMSPNEIPIALTQGVIDAVLVQSHPFSPLQAGIEFGEFKVLPWDEDAIAVLAATYPDSAWPSLLPANTYTGQTNAILGYLNLSPVYLRKDFTLTSDTTFSGSGFIIDADNITLDLGRHTVTGLNPVETSGVNTAGHKGITIKNGTIAGFGNGVLLYNSSNISIKNSRFVNNNIGVLCLNSSSNSVVDSMVYNSKNSGIILADNCDGNTVTNCTSNNNTVGGIWVNNGSDGNTIDRCTLKDNKFFGVYFGGGIINNVPSAPSNDNVVKKSQIRNNEAGGVRIINSDDNQILNCLIENNLRIGVAISGNPTAPASNNSIEGSLISRNYGGGIILDHADNNTITGNKIIKNGYFFTPPEPPIPPGTPPPPAGIALLSSCHNSISNNIINNNLINGIDLHEASNYNEIINNLITNNSQNGLVIGGIRPPNISQNNTISGNKFIHNEQWDIIDNTPGTGTKGTANDYENNAGSTSFPEGLFEYVRRLGK